MTNPLTPESLAVRLYAAYPNISPEDAMKIFTITPRVGERASRLAAFVETLLADARKTAELTEEDIAWAKQEVARIERLKPSRTENLHFVFDEPTSPEGAKFIEVEDDSGKSINIGEWRERPDDLWELIVPRSVDGADRIAVLESTLRSLVKKECDPAIREVVAAVLGDAGAAAGKAS